MAKSNFSNMNLTQIMMQQARQSADSPVYCRICGLNVKEPSKNSPGGAMGGWRQHIDWEVANRAHVKCTNQHFSNNRGKL